MRTVDNGYFCRLALEMAGAGRFPVWIVSDTRRRTDIRSVTSVWEGAVWPPPVGRAASVTGCG